MFTINAKKGSWFNLFLIATCFHSSTKLCPKIASAKQIKYMFNGFAHTHLPFYASHWAGNGLSPTRIKQKRSTIPFWNFLSVAFFDEYARVSYFYTLTDSWNPLGLRKIKNAWLCLSVKAHTHKRRSAARARLAYLAPGLSTFSCVWVAMFPVNFDRGGNYVYSTLKVV